jgi:hypothetical protein
MITYFLNGMSHAMPLTMLMTLGHNPHDREIANAILIHNGWLFRLNPMTALYLKGL